MQRILYRRNLFGEDGRGHVILLLRTITESEGNGDALIDPPHPRATEAGPAQASRSAGDANGGINPLSLSQVSEGTGKTKDMIGKK